MNLNKWLEYKKTNDEVYSLTPQRYHRQAVYVKKGERGRGLISIEDSVDTSIRRLEDNIKNEQRKTDYSDQKQHKEHNDLENKNSKETKMQRKTTVWIFQATNKWNLTLENLDMAKKRKP